MSALSLKVFDLVNRCWLSTRVEYRNTLLGHLFPDIEFAVGDCLSLLQEEEVDYDAIAKLLDAGWDDYRIVGASGSRKHGRIIYAPGGGDYFTRFFGSNANAINYGSNLTTECKSVVDLQVKLLVVEDGEWGTGDCHGKMSAPLAHTFAGGTSNPIQFRAACLADSWMAKGTIAYSYKVSRSCYDLVLPVSSFKGNKVAPGKYTVDLAIGVVFASPETKTKSIWHEVFKGVEVEEKVEGWDWRRANLSYSVIQFLPWDAVEKDILPATKQAATELNSLILNQRKLAEFLAKNEDEDEKGEGSINLNRLAEILKADIHGQITSHPWVVAYTTRMFKKRWLRLATAGAIRFNSSMVMPDEELADDTICIPGIPDGEEIIVFPYPCRWKHDIKVWRNVALESWEKSQGIIALNQQTALKLGRDFDGK